MLLPHPCPLSCPLLLLFAWSLEPGNLRQAWAMAMGRKVRDTGNQGWKEGLDQGLDPFRKLVQLSSMATLETAYTVLLYGLKYP